MITSSPSLAKLAAAEAWKPWQASKADPWSLKWAGHLLRRATFGASWGDLQEAMLVRPSRTIDRLMSGERDWERFYKRLDIKLIIDPPTGDRELASLQAQWVYRMLNTPHPLLEKMTLFWHNHFATSIAKVGRADLMQKQNDLIRRHALGKFGPFLLEMSKDPAMLIWLDSNSNVKGKPNENYAREVMELFSLGVGNYTEKDIREAARAFTGWHTDGSEFKFNPAAHDDGEKTVLDQTGNWDGGDIVRILLQQPAAARFLVRKLYRLLISETDSPPDMLIEPLAEQLRQSEYDIGAVVGTMLRSRLFFSDYAYRQRIKSPVEFVLGLVRNLERWDGLAAFTDVVSMLDGLGQVLYAPPSVKGWDGGKAWLNSATHVARHNVGWYWVGGEDQRFKGVANPHQLVKKHLRNDKDYEEQVTFFLELLLQGDVREGVKDKLLGFLAKGQPSDGALVKRLREMVHMILLMPEYQLA